MHSKPHGVPWPAPKVNNNLWLKNTALQTECFQIVGLQTELRLLCILLCGMKWHSYGLAHWYYRQLVHLREEKSEVSTNYFVAFS